MRILLFSSLLFSSLLFSSLLFSSLLFSSLLFSSLLFSSLLFSSLLFSSLLRYLLLSLPLTSSLFTSCCFVSLLAYSLPHFILMSGLFSHLISTSISIAFISLPFPSHPSSLFLFSFFQFMPMHLCSTYAHKFSSSCFSTYTKILRVLTAVCNLPCFCVLPQVSERHALLTRWEKPLICLLCMLISGSRAAFVEEFGLVSKSLFPLCHLIPVKSTPQQT